MSRKTTTAYASTLLSGLLALGVSAPASATDDDGFVDRISGIMQLDVTNAYFFRGILNEREGVQIQPWTELYFNLYSAEDGLIRDVTIGGGLWLSFQSERTLATEDPQWLYEADYYPLLSIGFAEGVSLTTTYYWYDSPNGAFKTVQELDLKLAWDDSEAFGRWSMQPWVNLAIETHQSTLNQDEGHEGQGVQLGIGPTVYATEDESFTLTAPCELGFAINNYYEAPGGGENTFGYGSVGLLASMPLSFVPESAGAWTFSLGAEYLFLSHTLEEINRGRSTYPVGTASLSVEF
ncbi:MAG: hypothetical protein ACREI8_03180 [Myxococcota bacterium]